MKKKLEVLIAKGKTEKVLAFLLSLTEKMEKPGLRTDIVILSNQFQEYLQNKNLGIYDQSEQRRILAQINKGLLGMIHLFDENELYLTSLKNIEIRPSKGLKPFYFIVSAIVLAFLVIATHWFYKTYFFETQPEDQHVNAVDNVLETGNVNSKKPKENPAIATDNKQNSNTMVEDDKKKAEVSERNPIMVLKGETVVVEEDSITSFTMGIHEVTIEQYQLFCNLTGYEFPESVDITDKRVPITYVSWKDANAYCDYLGARLPTVKEWEFAASGGKKGQKYRYSGGNSLKTVAWSNIFDNINGPQPVGKKKPNELGLYDMSGNVREWCSDEAEKAGYYYVKSSGWNSGSAQYYEPTKKPSPEPANSKNAMTGFRVVFNR